MRIQRIIYKILAWGLGIACLLSVLYAGSWYGQIWWWTNHNPSTSRIMQEQLAVLQAKNPTSSLKHQWVDYAKISIHVKKAVVAAEDGHFIDHQGFDWEGMSKALNKNIAKGEIVAGGSTISQQLAKNLFLSNKRNILRKLQEAVITWMIEQQLKKERILELYLNFAEWGNGIFGVQVAARHYFAVDAYHLTSFQSARLAAMLPRPRYYDIHRNSAWLKTYTQIIQNRLPSTKIP